MDASVPTTYQEKALRALIHLLQDGDGADVRAEYWRMLCLSRLACGSAKRLQSWLEASDESEVSDLHLLVSESSWHGKSFHLPKHRDDYKEEKRT